MPRKNPTIDVIRALFARSGNQCAFPKCLQPLVNDKNQFIGHTCHIEAANPGGERYNPNQTDDDRSAYNNLLLMCYPHHVETNEVDVYTVKKLREIKLEHESNFKINSYKIHEELLCKLALEMDEYWSNIEILNTVKHIVPDLAIPIKAKETFSGVMKEVHSLVEGIRDIKNYFDKSDELLMSDLLEFLKKLDYNTNKIEKAKHGDNPFINRNWEISNLSFNNTVGILTLRLEQLEIQYLEAYLKTNTTDLIAHKRLNDLKDEFKKSAQHTGFAD